MAATGEKTRIEDTSVTWTMPVKGRAWKYKRLAKTGRTLLTHMPIHMVAYAFFLWCVLHFMMPAYFPTKAIARFMLAYFTHVTPMSLSSALLLVLMLFIVAMVFISPVMSQSIEIGDSGVAIRILNGLFSHNLIKWRRIHAYKIVDDPLWSSLRFLSLQGRKSRLLEWPFDPAEVDEAKIRRIIEWHGIPDAGAGPWFTQTPDKLSR